MTAFNINNVYSVTNDWKSSFNGVTAFTDTTNAVSFVSNNAGNLVGGITSFYWIGDLPELVLYNRKLGTTERDQVNSYLATKYGITLGYTGGATQDYLNGNGTAFWSTATNGAYNKNITVIGRDDCQELNQKQSKSINTGSTG